MSIASRLMDEAVRFATKEGLKIMPLCTFAKQYLNKHPELEKIVVE